MASERIKQNKEAEAIFFNYHRFTVIEPVMMVIFVILVIIAVPFGQFVFVQEKEEELICAIEDIIASVRANSFEVSEISFLLFNLEARYFVYSIDRTNCRVGVS